MEVDEGALDGRVPTGRGTAPADVLVEPEWLFQNLESPRIVVLEVARDRPPAGEEVARLPGSWRVHWKDLLWDEKRRDFALPQVLADRLGRLGVSHDTELVICGDPIQLATYSYWVLRMMGHHRVRVLNGGKALSSRLGLPVSLDPSPCLANSHQLGPIDQLTRASREDVLGLLGSESAAIVDLRSDEEYLGLRVAPSHSPDHGAEARGRIPGANHLFYQLLLAPDGRFLGRDALGERFRAAGVGLDKPVVFYCRLGHRASLGWFCLSELLGFESARVYDGSWTEWGSMVGMPVER